MQNQEAGIRYGWNRDYDNLGSEKAVMDLLHNGVKSRFYKDGYKGYIFQNMIVDIYLDDF